MNAGVRRKVQEVKHVAKVYVKFLFRIKIYNVEYERRCDFFFCELSALGRVPSFAFDW